LDAYVRHHCQQINKPTNTLNEKSDIGHVNELSHPLDRIAQFPADSTEEDFQRGKGALLG